jgi:hypothetical protein
MLLFGVELMLTSPLQTGIPKDESGETILVRILIITVIAILGRLIEHAHKFDIKNKAINIIDGNIKSFYECLNVHLSLCLGVLGLIWAYTKNINQAIVIFIFILVGLVLKGVFSEHKPDRLFYTDRDALFGLYLPNACAFSAVIYGILITY